MFLKFSNQNAFKITWTSAKTQCSIFLLSHSSFASLQNQKRFKPLRLLLLLLVLLLLLLTDHNGMYLLALKESFFSLTHHLIDYRCGRDLNSDCFCCFLCFFFFFFLQITMACISWPCSPSSSHCYPGRFGGPFLGMLGHSFFLSCRLQQWSLAGK